MTHIHTPATIMGFARYDKKPGIDTADLIATAIDWRQTFLRKQPGIRAHYFLGNDKGQFADAILATDGNSFDAMSAGHMDQASSQTFMDMLDPASIRLCRNELLTTPLHPPVHFACIEFGTFRLAETEDTNIESLRAASNRIEDKYLSSFPEIQAHAIGKAGDDLYAEITFATTSGAARQICGGYVGNPDCQPLLDMADPASMDLDFWHLLA